MLFCGMSVSFLARQPNKQRDFPIWKAITFLCNLYTFGLEVLEFCHSVLWQNYYACGVVLSLGDEVLSLYDEVCCLRVEFPSRCVEVIF